MKHLIWFAIILIVLITVAMLVLRFFFKTAFKIISIIWLVLFLISIAFIIVLYSDARDIQKNFAESDNLFLMDSDGSIVAGFITKGGSKPEILSVTSELDSMYKKEEYSNMLGSGNYYKMFVFREESFEGLGEIGIGEINVSYEEVLSVIGSDDPVTAYADMLSKRDYSDSGNDANDPERIKGLMFAIMFGEANAEEGPFFMINAFKEGNAIIYPETIVFKMIKYFPSSLMEGVVKRLGSGDQ